MFCWYVLVAYCNHAIDTQLRCKHCKMARHGKTAYIRSRNIYFPAYLVVLNDLVWARNATGKFFVVDC